MVTKVNGNRNSSEIRVVPKIEFDRTNYGCWACLGEAKAKWDKGGEQGMRRTVTNIILHIYFFPRFLLFFFCFSCGCV